ncbi:hypothetical protein ACETAC_06840 [Aceticella autotrophica]|uniref:Uncharacterized protein n=1 Tax=Aceticella autotrophica TaxID=2755338 RepID=A0A975AUE3_9THEO|nr:hypothetical protein [Aceticella autotrophica]QSZ26626.1 hypothetical protein ACETAC_06840 [Aceticella autotrophica]
MSSSGGVEVIIFLQNRYIKFFEEKDAYSCEKALALNEIEYAKNAIVKLLLKPFVPLVIRKLLKYGVLNRCPDGKYFLDREAAYKFKRSFKKFLPF